MSGRIVESLCLRLDESFIQEVDVFVEKIKSFCDAVVLDECDSYDLICYPEQSLRYGAEELERENDVSVKTTQEVSVGKNAHCFFEGFFVIPKCI